MSVAIPPAPMKLIPRKSSAKRDEPIVLIDIDINHFVYFHDRGRDLGRNHIVDRSFNFHHDRTNNTIQFAADLNDITSLLLGAWPTQCPHEYESLMTEYLAVSVRARVIRCSDEYSPVEQDDIPHRSMIYNHSDEMWDQETFTNRIRSAEKQANKHFLKLLKEIASEMENA